MKVLTIGTFDLLHEGHLNLFNACGVLAAGGDVHVGVNTDGFVAKYKKVQPAIPFKTRCAVIEALSVVSIVHANEEAGQRLIRSVRPNILVIGTDWAAKDYYKQIGLSQEELTKLGILLVYVPYTQGISSTYLRGGLNEG